MEKCSLCPRECNINRNENIGLCGVGNTIRIGRAAPHTFEEPCISGTKGSGTIFFSGCSLRCVFCQNYPLWADNVGRDITVTELAKIISSLENCHNVSFVTGTHYTPQIAEAIDLAKSKVPTVWNSSGYEKRETLSLLKNKINVYLPDLKYYGSDLSAKFSGVADYFDIASKAISEMVLQRGKPVFDADGIMQSGVLVRHLVLPSHTDDSKKILSYLHSEYGNDVYISIMRQYTPMRESLYPELMRKLTSYEYDKVIDFADSIGITQAYIQEKGCENSLFTPEFTSDTN